MSPEDYRDGVKALYDGEVFGEGASSRLIALFAGVDPAISGLLLQMESEAKVKLRPLLLRHGLSIVESEKTRAAGVSFSDSNLAGLDWRTAMCKLAELSAPALAAYKSLLDYAPAEDHEVISFMVAHEEAFIRFAELEAAGRNAEARLAIVDLLEHPL